MAHGHKPARVVEREVNQSTGRTSQSVLPECDEVTVRFDVEIDYLRFRRSPVATSQENQKKYEHSETGAPSRKRRTTRYGTSPGLHSGDLTANG